MSEAEIKRQIVGSLPRDLIIDLWDVAVARARQAAELVRDHTDLQGRRARGLEGQARFRLMEQGFEEACLTHGGVRLEGDVIPGTELRYFQPFIRFGLDANGVLLGLASMPARYERPTKNMSRAAGVALNYRLTPRLDFDGDGAAAKPGDIFVLLMFARDPTAIGRVEEVAIGVIDAEYSAFLFYEPVEQFLAGYGGSGEAVGPHEGGPEPTGGGDLVKLKKDRRKFNAPEDASSDKASGDE